MENSDRTTDPVRHTSGTWRSRGEGGHSVVLTSAEPERNDTRIPPYGYDATKGYSIGYPFIEDDGRVRHDFVCFSHADARLIAAAPDLLGALITLASAAGPYAHLSLTLQEKLTRAVHAIAKAEGRS